jgi:hypothetical protein
MLKFVLNCQNLTVKWIDTGVGTYIARKCASDVEHYQLVVFMPTRIATRQLEQNG